MSQFVRSANALGLQQLLLSIRYIPVVDLSEQSTDELKAVAAQMQYELWDGMRLINEQSAEHRVAVNRLAARLVALTANLESDSGPTSPSGALSSRGAPPQTETRESVPPSTSSATPLIRGREVGVVPLHANEEDDSPGLLDLVADAQPAMESWTATLTSLGPVIERFNSKFQNATKKMNHANNRADAFARKILAARELAADVEPELSELERLSREYSSGLLRIDSTFRAVFELADLSDGDDTKAAKASLKENLSTIVQNSRQAMSKLEGAADAARKNTKLSRDLRPVLRRYETAVRNMVDGFAIIEEWESIDENDHARRAGSVPVDPLKPPSTSHDQP